MSCGASVPTVANAAVDTAVETNAPVDGGAGGDGGGGLHPDAEARMATARTLLRSHFGHSAFRPGQEAVLRILLTDVHGGSAVAIFPTSAGKSLCYQLPALVYPTGLTLVVSPLLALIKDQVDGLVAKGIPAANLDSTLDGPTVRDVYARVRDGSLRLLFVAPERFKNDRFRYLLRSITVELLAIDEAHCVSEWGQAFRPDYLRLARAAVEVGAVRRLALTATATDAVAADIATRFRVRPAAVLRTPFRRANVTTFVTTLPRRPPLPPGRAAPVVDDHRVDVLAARLRSQAPGRTIVYVTLQKGVAALAAALGQALGPSGGLSIRAYHAGLPADERTEVQEWFSAADPPGAPATVRVIVCTIAFGMGVDVCDIRYVYHFNAPKVRGGGGYRALACALRRDCAGRGRDVAVGIVGTPVWRWESWSGRVLGCPVGPRPRDAAAADRSRRRHASTWLVVFRSSPLFCLPLGRSEFGELCPRDWVRFERGAGFLAGVLQHRRTVAVSGGRGTGVTGCVMGARVAWGLIGSGRALSCLASPRPRT